MSRRAWKNSQHEFPRSLDEASQDVLPSREQQPLNMDSPTPLQTASRKAAAFSRSQVSTSYTAAGHRMPWNHRRALTQISSGSLEYRQTESKCLWNLLAVSTALPGWTGPCRDSCRDGGCPGPYPGEADPGPDLTRGPLSPWEALGFRSP